MVVVLWVDVDVDVEVFFFVCCCLWMRWIWLVASGGDGGWMRWVWYGWVDVVVVVRVDLAALD